jgi:hypothetical protein
MFAAAAIYRASTDMQDSSTVLCVTLMKENRTISRKAWSILMAVSGRHSAQTCHREGKRLSLIVPASILHKSIVGRNDERARRPMLRTAFHLAVPIRLTAAWSPVGATTVTNSWLTVVVFPAGQIISDDSKLPFAHPLGHP